MILDRISLIAVYDVLKIINENDGLVSNIFMNRATIYGTKTVPKMANIAELKQFIEDNYPYITWNPECECATCNEGVYTLLSFSIHLKGQRDAIFVNNLRKKFESAKTTFLNDLSVKASDSLFRTNDTLHDLRRSYVCFPYINTLNSMTYTNPCEYIEIIKNDIYINMIDTYYKRTKRPDFPKIIPFSQTPCGS
jgi:hypothetical protein